MTVAEVTTLSAERAAKRAQNVGASEVAALFGLHPHLTRFELWHRKAGNLEAEDLSGNARVFWGVMLEEAIGKGIAAEKGWKLRKVEEYVEHPTVAGMGSSPDFEILDHPRGRGTCQVKNVDAEVFRRWEDGEPPMVYQLQVQHEIACGGYAWGALACLVGGNRLEVFEYAPHATSIARIEKAVAEFWQSVREENPPEPDFDRDLETLREIYRATDAGKVLDLSLGRLADALPEGEEESPADVAARVRALAFADACRRYSVAGAEKKAAEQAQDAAKAELLTLIEDAAVAVGEGFKVSTWPVASAEVSFTRSAFRGMRVTDISADRPKKGKAAK